MTTEITLESLCGEHLLSGVDFSERTVERYGSTETVNVCRFRLDGTTYVAMEDPADGYRSSMGSLTTEEGPTTNEWSPVRVVGSMSAGGDYGQTNETLELRDVVTGETVLRVGTDNTEDYYPWWVAEFDPTALAHNKDKP
jgi:hypothetical protein